MDYRTEAQKDRESRGMVLFAGQEITKEAYDRIRGVEPKPRYVVLENTPGYLPEDDDPFVTDDYDAAVAYMNELVESYAESVAEGEGTPEIEWGMASNGNYAGAAVTDTSREHDLGRWFSVEICEDDEDETL